MDIRNINRNWPGKADGLLTERTAYAAMELIKQEGVDMTLDFHEAELEYAVENNYTDYADYEALYNGTASAEEILAAAKELISKVDESLIANADEDHPVDLTHRISQPSFEDGTGDWVTEREPQAGRDNFGIQASSQPTTDGTEFAGFFESIDLYGTVQNLNLKITIVSGNDYVGGLAGSNAGTIQGCMVSGNVSGSDWVGGVVGYNGIGSITDCYWKKGPEQGVGTDYGTGTPDVTQINDDVPMQTAIAVMNNYLTGYQYELKGDQIVLVASNSNTPEVSGLTQKVLDAARMIGL